MPKVAVLSDIHGNLHALRAVLREVAEERADLLCVAGDVVGYGAHPRECLELLHRVGAHLVFGNHESYAVLIAREGPSALEGDWASSPVYAGIVHTIGQLGREQTQELRRLPWARLITEDTAFAHSTLHEPQKWHYLLSDEDARPTLEVMRSRGLEVAFFGHTHRQDWFAHAAEAVPPVSLGKDQLRLPQGCRCAITVGSVGQPRGGENDPRASWALWDTESRTMQFRKTEYPVEKAVEAILEAGLPPEAADRLQCGG